MTAAAAPAQTPAECVLAAAEATPATAAVALGLTNQQVLNLAQLARHLRRVYPAGPAPSFGMADWYLDNGSAGVPEEVIIYPGYTTALQPNECGTTACAVGHGPAAGVQPLDSENWRQYLCRCFTGRHDFSRGNGEYLLGEVYDSDLQPHPSDGLYRAIFHQCWASTDNTARGAAARICYALQHGVGDLWPGRQALYAEYVA